MMIETMIHTWMRGGRTGRVSRGGGERQAEEQAQGSKRAHASAVRDCSSSTAISERVEYEMGWSENQRIEQGGSGGGEREGGRERGREGQTGRMVRQYHATQSTASFSSGRSVKTEKRKDRESHEKGGAKGLAEDGRSRVSTLTMKVQLIGCPVNFRASAWLSLFTLFLRRLSPTSAPFTIKSARAACFCCHVMCAETLTKDRKASEQARETASE
eukprot:187822-Rhodomonas_salina.1